MKVLQNMYFHYSYVCNGMIIIIVDHSYLLALGSVHQHLHCEYSYELQ